RSKVIARLAGQGAMVSLAASASEANRLLEPFGGRVSLAAVNGPSSVVVACDRESAGALLARCAAQEVRAREIPATGPTHSGYGGGLREGVLGLCEPIGPRSGGVPYYSTAIGAPLDTAELTGEYWYSNLRQTVQFESAVRALLSAGRRTFIEISPHPVLTAAVQDTVDDALTDAGEITAVGAPRRRHG